MKRSELIDKAKELDLNQVNGKPLQNCATVEIERAVKALLPQAQVGTTIKSRIIELGKQGLTKKAIEQTMLEEGCTRIRYQYIMLVLKQEGIEVPSAKTGRK